jgi:cyclic pyranopterin phosphate synthase
MNDLTHFDHSGMPRMVDVSEKNITHRTATAGGTVKLNKATFEKVAAGEMKKGDVLGVAQVAGIMAAKKCSELIPMCHPISITGVEMSLIPVPESSTIRIEATVKCKGETGVEMEAMTAVSVAALTVYDMCKAVQRDIEISDIVLLKKSGGKSGDYVNTNK